MNTCCWEIIEIIITVVYLYLLWRGDIFRFIETSDRSNWNLWDTQCHPSALSSRHLFTYSLYLLPKYKNLSSFFQMLDQFPRPVSSCRSVGSFNIGFSTCQCSKKVPKNSNPLIFLQLELSNGSLNLVSFHFRIIPPDLNGQLPLVESFIFHLTKIVLDPATVLHCTNMDEFGTLTCMV